MSNKVLTKLRSKYQAEIDLHKTNIEVFIENSVGVADHINYGDTIEKELEQIAKYKDLIDALDEVSE